MVIWAIILESRADKITTSRYSFILSWFGPERSGSLSAPTLRWALPLLLRCAVRDSGEVCIRKPGVCNRGYIRGFEQVTCRGHNLFATPPCGTAALSVYSSDPGPSDQQSKHIYCLSTILITLWNGNWLFGTQIMSKYFLSSVRIWCNVATSLRNFSSHSFVSRTKQKSANSFFFLLFGCLWPIILWNNCNTFRIQIFM